MQDSSYLASGLVGKTKFKSWSGGYTKSFSPLLEPSKIPRLGMYAGQEFDEYLLGIRSAYMLSGGINEPQFCGTEFYTQGQSGEQSRAHRVPGIP